MTTPKVNYIPENKPYSCKNPTMHNILGLKCSCYNRQRQRSYISGEVEKGKPVQFTPVLDPYIKEAMRKKPTFVEESAPKFIPDWKNWNRFVWSPNNFYGGQLGGFNMKVTYENVEGCRIVSSFYNRIPHIVSESNGFCVLLKESAKSGYIQFNFDPEPKNIQFAVMSPTISATRKDCYSVFVNGNPVNGSDFYCGTAANFSGNTFTATKPVQDSVGDADTLFKITNDGIKTLRIEFTNLSANAEGGRLALTDILIK
jgi:hypothetical protein